MKFTKRRGVAYTTEILVALAVVLGIGGVYAAFASGLINAAGSSSSLQVVGSSLVGGSSPALSITLKNVGTTTIASGTVTISLNVPGATGCTDSMSGSITWTGVCTGTTAPITWTGTSNLAPGAQLSLAVTFGGTAPTITSGNTYSLIATLGGASASTKLTAA